MGYLFIALTVLFTVYGQLVLKWQVGLAGTVPDTVSGKITFLLNTLTNPWVISGLGSAFIASLFWMLALSKLPLSTAYPYTATSFLLILLFGATFFSEPVTLGKILGTALIVGGIAVLSLKG